MESMSMLFLKLGAGCWPVSQRSPHACFVDLRMNIGTAMGVYLGILSSAEQL